MINSMVNHTYNRKHVLLHTQSTARLFALQHEYNPSWIHCMIWVGSIICTCDTYSVNTACVVNKKEHLLPAEMELGIFDGLKSIISILDGLKHSILHTSITKIYVYAYHVHIIHSLLNTQWWLSLPVEIEKIWNKNLLQVLNNKKIGFLWTKQQSKIHKLGHCEYWQSLVLIMDWYLNDKLLLKRMQTCLQNDIEAMILAEFQVNSDIYREKCLESWFYVCISIMMFPLHMKIKYLFWYSLIPG